jgi:hypothetical protein
MHMHAVGAAVLAAMSTSISLAPVPALVAKITMVIWTAL